MVDNRYYTVKTAAETLAIADEQVLVLIHSGELRAANLAKPGSQRPRWRIAEADLGRFLLSRLHPASTTPKPVATRKAKAVRQYV